MGTFLTNSIKVAIIATVGQVLTCSMAGFAFARLRFPGRQLLFVLLLITPMVPTQVTLVPSFFVMRWLGWIDTLRSLTVPYWTGGALGTFLARQFFLTVPDELMEAATLDGAGYWRIYVSIFMPLALPVLATIGILTFLASWNNLLSPLIFISSEAKMTLTLGLTLLQGQYLTPWPLVMAGALISMIPPMVVFLVAQRYLVEGVARTGLKG
jgi:multiple sugar transport system permease protein